MSLRDSGKLTNLNGYFGKDILAKIPVEMCQFTRISQTRFEVSFLKGEFFVSALGTTSSVPGWRNVNERLCITLNPTGYHSTIVLRGLRGALIGLPLCRETPASRTADVSLFAVWLPKGRNMFQ